MKAEEIQGQDCQKLQVAGKGQGQVLSLLKLMVKVSIFLLTLALPTVNAQAAGITVTPTSGLTTTEAGGADTFTVALDTLPTDDVI
ncbi:MAG: hypothetical protein CO149_00320, partial [Nitrospirae bacterium CG_4_9_14_3_um_filter_51_5]